MKDFDFEKFEKIADVFAETLKTQMQTRMFNPLAPSFDVTVSVFDKGRGFGKAISVETSDIAKHMNFNMFAAVKLHNFGGGVMKHEPEKFWLPIDWRWEHKDGGSNGAHAFTLIINDAGEILEVREA